MHFNVFLSPGSNCCLRKRRPLKALQEVQPNKLCIYRARIYVKLNCYFSWGLSFTDIQSAAQAKPPNPSCHQDCHCLPSRVIGSFSLLDAMRAQFESHGKVAGSPFQRANRRQPLHLFSSSCQCCHHTTYRILLPLHSYFTKSARLLLPSRTPLPHPPPLSCTFDVFVIFQQKQKYSRNFPEWREGFSQGLRLDLGAEITHEDVIVLWKQREKIQYAFDVVLASKEDLVVIEVWRGERRGSKKPTREECIVCTNFQYPHTACGFCGHTPGYV